VVLFDATPFVKIEVSGPGALAYLQRIAANQMDHPIGKVTYTAMLDERGGIVFFVMALVEGESLAARLARQPRLSIDAVRRILGEVADALDYAHACGVVHRDIKPDNILIDRATGRALVTDFGIARAAAGDARLTLTGVAVGTPAYMSPEQAMGERDVDGRSDQYSLGIVGYQMLVGQTPFKAANTPAMLVKHLSEIPRPVQESRPDVPPALAGVIDRALAKKPEERWPSAGAFRDALNQPPSSGAAAPAWSSSAPSSSAGDAVRCRGQPNAPGASVAPGAGGHPSPLVRPLTLLPPQRAARRLAPPGQCARPLRRSRAKHGHLVAPAAGRQPPPARRPRAHP